MRHRTPPEVLSHATELGSKRLFLEAREVLREALRRPECRLEPLLWTYLSSVEAITGSQELARSVLEEGVSELPKSSVLRLRLVSLMLAQDAELSTLREQFDALCGLELDHKARNEFPGLVKALRAAYPHVDWPKD